MKNNFLALLFLTLSFLGYSQDPITFETQVKKISENTFELVTTANIQNNWRLYSQNLSSGGAIPTEFIFNNKSQSIKLIGDVKESQSITKFDPIFQVEQSYFVNKSIFTQLIETNKTIDNISAVIAYQACDDIVCIFREANLIFNFDGSTLAIDNIDLTSDIYENNNALEIDLKNTELLSTINDSSALTSNSYLNLFILGFIGGLLALLTPCVFPMIPLTVSFFTNNNSKNNSKFNAITYGLFIIGIYLSLSIPFHFLDSINPEILNSISTNAGLNIFFFIVFVLFAFSFFGFYEITIPSKWVNSIDSKSNSIGGYIGIFFMALTLVLVSFSCTGPILGSLLVGSISSQGGAIQLTIGMLGFGVALALPFTIFALFPNLLSTLPKSGRWMNTFKVILGFLELGFAFKFLSNADLVEHWGILKREVFIGIWVLISFALSMYLLGLYKFPHENKSVITSKFNLILGFFVLGFSVYLFPALLQNGSDKARILSGFTPPAFYSVYSKSNDCPLGFTCFKDFDSGLSYAKSQNKPILLDFTGWACVNCRRIEENVWTDPQVYSLINDNFVLISLYVDDRKELDVKDFITLKYKSGKEKIIKTVGEKGATFQAINFKSASQPYYVLLDNDLRILNKPIQYTSKDKYLNWLKEGLGNL
ncbi:thioredoxin family protein [Flavobacteriaceae bacterium]|nr:thioredoxin family protein [Flavobacteriaceae bacterium]MDB4050518.1 thioredoxin family protein [Flavobacteriaceae bacterium]MDB4086473.1 thioredoxin family protein [Flavobacteriaceae bacterium]